MIFVRALLPLLFLWGGLALAEGSGNQPPPQVTAADVANQLIIHQRFAEAEGFLRQQLEGLQGEEEERNVLRYLLALALSGQQKYGDATDILRDILDANPHLTQFRLSLGRVLFLQGVDASAERQFDLVLADENAPPRMHDIARQHLEAIRNRNGWVFSTFLNVSESSNINGAPDSGSVVYVAGLPLSSTKGRRERGVRFAWNGSANYRRLLKNDLQWSSGIAAHGNARAGAWDDGTGVQVYTGPRFLAERSVLDVAGFAGYNWDNGHPASSSTGLRATYLRVLESDWRASFSLQYVRQNDINNDDADADVYFSRAGLSFGLSPATSGSAEVSATRSRAEEETNSHFTARAALNLQHDFAFGFTLGGGFSIYRTLRDAPFVLIGYRQRDVVKSTSVSLLKRDWRIFGFAPKLSVSRNIRDSNIATESSKDTVTAIDFTRDF